MILIEILLIIRSAWVMHYPFNTRLLMWLWMTQGIIVGSTNTKSANDWVVIVKICDNAPLQSGLEDTVFGKVAFERVAVYCETQRFGNVSFQLGFKWKVLLRSGNSDG